MPTPNVYASGNGYPEQNIPEVQRTAHIDLLYMTDRLADMQKGGCAMVLENIFSGCI